MQPIAAIATAPNPPTKINRKKFSVQFIDTAIKIKASITSFFAHFACKARIKTFLRPREVKRLRDDCLIAKASTALSQKDITRYTDQTKISDASKIPLKIETSVDYTVHDQSLEGIRQFSRDLVSMLIDVVHDKYLSPKLETVQNSASSIPSVIKPIAKLLVEMGDKASKPLFKKFAMQKAQVIDPALKRIFKTLLKEDPSVDISPVDSQNAIYKALQKGIWEELNEIKISHKRTLESDYIVPILDWLILSDQSTPLISKFEPLETYHEDVIDKVFEKAITLLVEIKIDQYANIVEKTMQRHLGDIVLQTMHINAERITDFFTDRIAELIGNMQFASTYDKVLQDVVAKHIDSYITAEQQQVQDRALLDNVNRAAQLIPRNSEEMEMRVKALNHLASIEKHGGVEEFFYHIFLESFAKQPGCSSQTQELIQQQIELTLKGKDPSFNMRESKREFFNKLSDRLIELMLPKRKRVNESGNIEEADPFLSLWNRLYFPPEFHVLENHIKELAGEFVTPAAVSIISRFLPNKESLQGIFKSIVLEALKKHLSKFFQLIFDILAQPSNLNKLFGENILPSLNEQLIKAFIGQQIGANPKIFAPLFLKLIQDPPSQRTSHIEALQDLLMKLVRLNFHQFNEKKYYAKITTNEGTPALTFSGLDEDSFRDITDKAINKIETRLLLAQKDKPPFSLQDLINILNVDDEPPPETIEATYGKSTMDLIFRVGSWSNEGLIRFAIKDLISRELTGLTKELRASHEYLITNITESLARAFLKRERIEELLAKRNEDIDPFIEDKLAHQISLTSSLSHDMIMFAAHQKSLLGKLFVKPFLTDNSKKLDGLITTVYHKIFGNQVLNENLLIRFCEELFSSLEASAKHVGKIERNRIRQLISD